ncbi:MAG: hypothetical protein ACOYL6_16610 [Bacteriovoracaceae bacterium]
MKLVILAMGMMALSSQVFAVDLEFSLDKCEVIAQKQIEAGFLCKPEIEAVNKAGDEYRANPTEENKAKVYAALKTSLLCKTGSENICAAELYK